MKLKTLIYTFISLWVISAISVPLIAGNLQDANNFGGSFGGVSALFSGLALAMAIYSMVLQQKQGEEFEKRTLGALEQQAAAIKLIEQTLIQQANAAKVSALSTLIDQEQRRIADLKEWGESVGNKNKYQNGIQAAQKRVEEYREQLRNHAEG